MTTEQASQEMTLKEWCERLPESHLVNRQLAKLEQQWIPVSERLPESQDNVFVSGGIAYYRVHDETWYTVMEGHPWRPIQWEVTHWMPLPPPPTE